MKISMKKKTGYATFKRGPNDPKVYNDSILWYMIRKELLKKGHDVIKKLMHKDGNMVDSFQHYVRTRNYFTGKGYGYALHFGNYMLRPMYQDWNEGKLTLEFHENNTITHLSKVV